MDYSLTPFHQEWTDDHLCLVLPIDRRPRYLGLLRARFSLALAVFHVCASGCLPSLSLISSRYALPAGREVDGPEVDQGFPGPSWRFNGRFSLLH